MYIGIHGRTDTRARAHTHADTHAYRKKERDRQRTAWLKAACSVEEASRIPTLNVVNGDSLLTPVAVYLVLVLVNVLLLPLPSTTPSWFL